MSVQRDDRNEVTELDVNARKVLEEIATVGTGVDVQLDQHIRILVEYRALCEQRENYREAELVQHVLKHLRLEEETRHVKGITEQQELERRGLEEAHAEEFRKFNQVWNEKIDEFEDKQVTAETLLLEKHAEEINQFHQEMATKNFPRAKYSKDLLNLRSIQHTLASQRNYTDASKVKLKCDRIESEERERANRESSDTYQILERQVLQRHSNELAALRMRMEREKVELERGRKRELEMLIQRYNNVRRGMESHQNIIRSKTGSVLLKHANNKRTDHSGSYAIRVSMGSGAFGPGAQQKREAGEFNDSNGGQHYE